MKLFNYYEVTKHHIDAIAALPEGQGFVFGDPECFTLSRQASDILEVGDKIDWWDTTNNLPALSCGGIIQKIDGREYVLTGHRDVGMRTGYKPRLRLKTKVTQTAKQTVWESYRQTPILKHIESGKVYVGLDCFPPFPIVSLGDYSLEQLLETKGVVEFDESQFPVPEGDRAIYDWEEVDMYKVWQRGRYRLQRQVVVEIVVAEELDIVYP